jgi:ornithine cyclodeaminase
VWGRNISKAQSFALEPFHITVAEDLEQITQNCNLIVTTTPSSKPLLFGQQLRPGTHITAVGADDPSKQELDATVFEQADLIIVDSLTQCLSHGDLSHAKNIDVSSIIELGTWIQKPRQRKRHWITVADLTGLAIEDLQVAKAVYSILKQF